VSSCGNTANAAASGEAWNEAPSPSLGRVVFGHLESSDGKGSSQAACESPQPGVGTVGGGDGGSGGPQWYICYYTYYFVGHIYVGYIFWGCTPL
jgi:hypothetical protein